MEHKINLHIEKLPEGYYLATSDVVQGLVAQGRTIAETLEIARDLAKKLLEAQTDESRVVLDSFATEFEYPLVVSTWWGDLGVQLSWNSKASKETRICVLQTSCRKSWDLEESKNRSLYNNSQSSRGYAGRYPKGYFETIEYWPGCFSKSKISLSKCICNLFSYSLTSSTWARPKNTPMEKSQ